MIHELPASIARLTENLPFTTDSTGMSGSEIRLYPDFVFWKEDCLLPSFLPVRR